MTSGGIVEDVATEGALDGAPRDFRFVGGTAALVTTAEPTVALDRGSRAALPRIGDLDAESSPSSECPLT